MLSLVKQWQSQYWNLGNRFQSPGSVASLFQIELFLFANSTPTLGTRDQFSRLGGRSLPPKRRVLVALGRCRALAGAWGGVGALSPDRWRPAHLFISEAALDWISRCLSPSEEQCAGAAAERAAANPAVIDRSGTWPPAWLGVGVGGSAELTLILTGESAAGERAGS